MRNSKRLETNSGNPNLVGKHVTLDGILPTHEEFPMDEVIARLDGDHNAETMPIADSSKLTTAQTLKIVLDWICLARCQDARARLVASTRALALRWVLDPGAFGNLPAHEVAARYGIPATRFSSITAECSRHFKVQNQFQLHDAKNPSQPKPLLSHESNN
jgi:hypothetical protein